VNNAQIQVLEAQLKDEDELAIEAMTESDFEKEFDSDSSEN
jgi:hypothetical protein